MKKEILPQLMREKMIKDRRIRRAITTNSHLAFFHFISLIMLNTRQPHFKEKYLGLANRKK